MGNVTIEKMEIKRFNALLLRTIVGLLFMGGVIWSSFSFDIGRDELLSMWCIPFNLLYVVVAWRASTVLEKIKKDKRMAGALDSEIYSDYNHKALATGFYAAIVASLLVYCFGGWLHISLHTATLLIITIALFSSEIRKLLLYNPYKDGK